MASEDYTRDSARTYGRTWPRTVAEPTLFLNFTSATSLDPRITFSRGSQATLFDSTGTLVYAKHNLVTWSQDFSQADWSKNSSTIVSTSVASPITSTNYQKIEATVANTTVGITSIAITAATQQRTVSFFAKPLGDITRVLVVIQGADARINVNLVDGTFTTNVAATGSSVAVAGERFIVSTPTLTGATGVRLFLKRVGETDTNTPTTIAIGEGLYLIGAQMNVSNMEGGVTSSLTTYYPTTTAAYYAPRFDYDPSTLQPLGLLIEEQRTNSIRNNTMQGAVAGTPGTAPTNWSVGGSANGITSSIGTPGAINGISFLDVTLAGTASASATHSTSYDTASAVAASAGQVWTGSVFLAIPAGGLTGISEIRINHFYYNATPTFLSNTSSADIKSLITSTPQRFSFAATVPAGAAFVRLVLVVAYTNGSTVSITIRQGLPQLELGAFATSVIPTFTTALTRNADIASMTGTNFSSWYNASEGTFVAQYLPSAVAASNAGQCVIHVSNGTATEQLQLTKRANVDASTRYRVDAGGVNSSFLNLGTFTATQTKAAITYKVDDFVGIKSGGSLVTDTSGGVPAPNKMDIGTELSGSSSINGHIQRIAYYPTRLPNATLQALTL